MADRLGVEHRALEGFRRADVGLRRAGLHGDAIADAAVFDDAAGNDFALLDEIVELAEAERGHVPGRAGDELLVERLPDLEVDFDLVAGRLFETGCHFAHPRRRGLVEVDGDLGRTGGGRIPSAERGNEAGASRV
jgi:hypothetical protein